MADICRATAARACEAAVIEHPQRASAIAPYHDPPAGQTADVQAVGFEIGGQAGDVPGVLRTRGFRFIGAGSPFLRAVGGLGGDVVQGRHSAAEMGESAPPARISMATYRVSVTSASVAPKCKALRVWWAMQESHCVVSDTASAINSLVFLSSAASAYTALSKSTNFSNGVWMQCGQETTDELVVFPVKKMQAWLLSFPCVGENALPIRGKFISGNFF